MRWRCVLLVAGLLATLAPDAQAALIIDGFAVDLGPSDADDAIALRNTGTDAVDLSAYRLNDHEGTLTFPPGAALVPGGRIVVAEDAAAWLEATGQPADYALNAQEPGRRMAASRSFSLSKSGDELLVEGPTADVVVFGAGTDPQWSGAPVPLAGGTFLRWFPRADPTRGADASAWTQPRRAHVGDDLFPAVDSRVTGQLIAYTAPEQSRGVVHAALLAARASIRLNVYQFRDLGLARDVADHLRAHPGITMDVLLDAQPVGESQEELSQRAHVIRTLVDAGALIRFLPHTRYAYDHAKYLVVDDDTLLVQTENLVDSGIPLDGQTGNRGWGVVISNATLAQAAARVFDADFRERAYGAIDASGETPRFPSPIPGTATSSAAGALRVGFSGSVRFLATPFSGEAPQDPFLALIGDATRRIDVIQLDFAPQWRTPTGGAIPHPYLTALQAAAARGVHVRVLLDGHFLDETDAMGDNAATLAFAAPNLEVRLQRDPRPVVHAKGMLVDGRWVIVGSMNWNSNSLLQNREVGLAVDAPDAAAFFGRSFESDWRADAAHTVPTIDGATVIITSLVLLAGRRPRR